MPLKPTPHGLLRPFFKGMYVIEQKEALCQGLSNAASLTFLPHPHTSSWRKRFAVEQKFRFPRLRGLRWGRYARPNLGLQLMDYNASGWSGRSPNNCISRTCGRLLSNPLPFPESFGLRRRWRRRRLCLALRGWLLHGLPRTRHEEVYGHGLLGHHVFVKKGLGVWQISYVNYKMLGFLYGSLGFNRVLGLSGFLDGNFFLDRFMGELSETPRHTLLRLVPQWCYLIRVGVSLAQFPRFTNCKFWRQKACVPNVYVWQKGVFNQHHLFERLPGRINQFNLED